MIAQLDRQKKKHFCTKKVIPKEWKFGLLWRVVKSALKNMSKLDKWWRKEVVCLKQTNKKKIPTAVKLFLKVMS